MSDTDGRADLALQERIDELATRLVLDGPGSEVAAELAQLSEMASGKGCPDTARIAA